ncbi:MAG: hypothetical protein IBX64_02545 [Actinobacteria bacterium]|nr:hypothetical protein [Actinomycetota bacterium]
MILFGLPLTAWVIVLITALFAILWVQIIILHYRGAFHRIWMWGPILYLPVVIITGITALVFQNLALDIYGVLLIITLLMGLSGLFFHIQGIVRQVGGWNLDNIMVGPPPMFPLSLSLISLVGIIAVYFRRF